MNEQPQIPIPQPPSPSPQSAAGSTNGGTDNLNESGNIPIELNDSVKPLPLPTKNDDATAQMIAGALDATCALYAYGLTHPERDDFIRDLRPVLAKYDVPSLPYQQEFALALTTGRILGTRIMAKRAAAQQEDDGDDSPSTGETGQREERTHQEAGRAWPGSSSQADDLLP